MMIDGTPPALTGVSSLPLSPTPLLGRRHDVAAAKRLLTGGVRLLTLTGPAGVGKTRLALAVARELPTAFAHGVYFADLTACGEAQLVPAAVARALQVPVAGEEHPLEVLAGYLGRRQLLLVLDNFERVVQAAPQLAGLLAGCPGLALLVTSRVRLHLRWEQVHEVGALPVPALTPSLPPLATLARVPSVELFVSRSRAHRHTFRLSADNAEAVATLCRYLGGLPLALELAAAQARVFAPDDLLRHLQGRLPDLGWPAADLPERQRSLRAAVAWSYDLLPNSGQRLFRLLGVFAGGWTLEAAQTLLGDARAAGGLRTLIDASLVQTARAGGPRYHLLEALREFAREQLTSKGEIAAARAAHLRYYAAFAEEAASALKGPGQTAWFRCLEAEHDNLRAALHTAAEREGDELLRLAGSLGYFWWTRGYVREGRGWLDRALERPPEHAGGGRTAALAAAGLLAGTLGDYPGAAARLAEAHTLAQRAGDAEGALLVLSNRAIVAWLRGDAARLPGFLAEYETLRSAAAPWTRAYALHALGLLAGEERRSHTALECLEASLELYETVGDRYRVVAVQSTLAACFRAGST